MLVKPVWNSRDCVDAVVGLPTAGPLPRRVVLVRRERVAHSLRRELIRAGFGSVLAGTRFVPFSAAATEVLRIAGISFQAGEEDLRPVRLSALFSSEIPLRHFSYDLLRSKPGWDEAFARTILDLESAGVRPDDLDAAGQSERLRDVAAIWRRIDETAGSSWTTQRAYLEAAAALIAQPRTWIFQGAVLVLVGGEVTSAEARFFRAIPEVTVGVLVARPARERSLNRLEVVLDKKAASILRSTAHPKVCGTERDLLSSYLFEPPAVLADPGRPRSAGPDDTVDIEEHAGVEAEIEATTDWVARQIAKGTALEEIAVFVPALDPLAGLIADRLARLPWHDGSFPVHVAGGLRMTCFATGARALAVVRALRTYLSAESLGDVLPTLRSSAPNGRHLSRAAAMNLVWTLGTVGGNAARPQGALDWAVRAAERERELSEFIARAKALDGESVETGVARRAIDVDRSLADLRAVRPALEALVALARLALEGANLTALWPRLFHFFDQWLLQPGEGPRGHTLLKETLDRMACDAQCGSLAGVDALRVIEETITATRLPIGRFGDPAVYLGTIRDAVGLRFRAVRFIGLAEGHFPTTPSEDAVIPGALREYLQTQYAGTMVLLPTAVDHSLDDLQALDLVVRSVESHVAFSASRLDIDRSEREPSSVFLEIAAALARPNRSTGEAAPTVPDTKAIRRDSFVPSHEAAAEFRRQMPLSESAWQDCVSERTIGVPPHWQTIEALDLARLADMISLGPGSPLDGIVETTSQIEVPGLTPDLAISPSSLVTLLRCPHEFLLRNLLGFEEPTSSPTQREIAPREYGQLLHAVASKFYNRNGVAFSAHEGTLADWISRAEEIVADVFQTFLNEYPLVGEAVQLQQRERLRRDVCELIEYDWEEGHERQFSFAERVFGRPVPVELELGDHSLFVRGRIDRIDIKGPITLVRDLKTGRAYPRVGKNKNPDPALDVQIAIYGLVVQALAEEWKVPKQVAVAYTYVGRSAAVERAYNDDFHTLLEPTARHWLAVAAGLLADRKFPRTPNADDCTYCRFRPVCGEAGYSRSSALLANAEGTLVDFGALKGIDRRDTD